MADKGPGPATLILKRLEVSVRRLEHTIASQELELMELEERCLRLRENITASEKVLDEQRAELQSAREQHGG